MLKTMWTRIAFLSLFVTWLQSLREEHRLEKSTRRQRRSCIPSWSSLAVFLFLALHFSPHAQTLSQNIFLRDNRKHVARIFGCGNTSREIGPSRVAHNSRRARIKIRVQKFRVRIKRVGPCQLRCTLSSCHKRERRVVLASSYQRTQMNYWAHLLFET